MKLNSREQNGVIVLEPKGKIMGGPDATILKEAIRDHVNQNAKNVVIDLKEVDWMNSTGLGIMISCLKTVREAGGEMKLSNVTDKIKSLLTITKLITVFDAYNSTDEAVASIGKQ
ncbi:MAG: STAS domain-containing protein [candidate division Zixibacteria bacterium]|jgi:anti-sigma B factor antagonist|nr:STAS domain-containing protein [candidate division Zixibacteria bacterium]